MSSGRQRYLVSYDISDPKRLRLVHKTVTDFGQPMQYSVFVCDLDPVELLWLKEDLYDIINTHEDSVAIIDLGPPDGRGARCFDFMGVAPTLPSQGPMIV